MPGKKYYFWRISKKKNLNFIRILLILMMGSFYLRLFHLQIVKGSYYWREAEENRIQFFSIPAPRGRIFDLNGTKLVGNQPRYCLYVSPVGLTSAQKEEITDKIHQLTGRSKEIILKRFMSKDRLPFGVLNILPYLSRDEIITIEENLHYLPSVSIQVEPVRKYPFGENGFHFLGYIGEVSKEELSEKSRMGYKLKDLVGKSGLEKVCDQLLRGRDGFQEIEVGVAGHHRNILDTQLPKIGNDLLLTIDWNLQQKAKEAIGDNSGAVVAMNPCTGEILVWLSQPGFNPEDFTLPFVSDRLKEVFQNPDYPLFDRVIQGQYAPGSLFKLVTSIAALESEKFDVNTEYVCNGYVNIGYDRRVYRCWKDKKHGRLNLKDAIANSCNVYFYQLGMDLGADAIHKTALTMGMGESSQNIFWGESPGLIPHSEWKEKKFGKAWYPGDSANMSVGQGYVLLTPMKILKMISVIAADGKIYRPHMVKMVVSPQGKVIRKFEPHLARKVDISQTTMETIKEAMKGVVEYGTAQYLHLPFEVAAKTGTAENPFGDDHAWFACFAPIDKPQIAIVVLIENGGYGSVAAMPVAREILREKFRKVYAKAD